MTAKEASRAGGRRRDRSPRAPTDGRTPAQPLSLATLGLALAVATAFALRFWALRHQPFVTVDGTDYIRLAEALLQGQALASIFPPGYPALIALVRVLVEDRVMAAAIVSLVAGALLPFPVWLLARRAAGERWAVGAAFAVALHPELARFSALTMSESAFILALYASLAWAAAARPFLAGLAIGAAFTIRPEALVSAAALAVREAWRVTRKRSGPRALAGFAAGFLLLAIPCWIWFRVTLGEWTPTPKVGAMRATTVDWRIDEPRLASDSTTAATPASRGAGVALRQYPSNAVAHGRSLLLLWPLPWLALSLWGLFRRRGVEAIPLIELALIPFLGLSEQPRFVLAAIPALAILAVVGASAGGKAWRIAAGVLALVGVAMCALGAGPLLKRPFDGWVEAHRRAGLWLSGVAEPGDAVMDRKPYVAFYARGAYRVMPDAPYETLVSHAVESKVRYLVVDQKVAEVFRRQLEPLLYDAEFRERETRLELIYVGGQRGYGVGLFRVLAPGEARTGRAPFIDTSYPPEPRPR